ncbi:MAG: response regulator, partial [Bacteroidota bacterium]
FANISHELRTPLALIAIPIQEKLQRNDLPEKERKEYELILRNNGRLNTLVDQLLDLSKLESGNLSLKVMETNAQNFFEAQLEPYRYFSKSQELDFQISMNLKEERIWIDREAIQKILSNLFSNAIKHSAANGRVNGHFEVTSQELAIVVKNTSAPFTKLQKEQLFNRFYQTDEFNEGAGIGLALVKELVQLHKGKIEVNDGDGFVTFKVVLPCHKSDFKSEERYEGTAMVSTPQEPVMPLGNTIAQDEESIETDGGLPLLLIVEDNLDLRTVLQETFKNDYRIVVAVNGEEGVQLAIEQVPDLIISDVMMPKKNGVELTKELKAHELTSHIPIILLTAKAGDENELTGIDSGAD